MSAGCDNSNPLVSVLICTYNRPQYLPEALRSIFAQTYPQVEVILTRDGGQPVREHISEYRSDRRLILIDRDENRGKAYSLNRAFERATGKYICYLDDDDAWFPNHIQTLVNALERKAEFGLAYSDLYKAHCRDLPDGRRVVLSKNVEISRDFDRMMLLQFNHALHVSVMHRRDLLQQAGGYNENLNVLIDWDLTRRLCFYTDFLHVPVVTGQYYAPVGDCDRISVRQRKNVQEYLRNLLTIRTTRPPKPWPCMPDLAVVVIADKCDNSLEQTLQMLWSQSFYPRVIYLPLGPDESKRFRTGIPDVVPVPVRPGASAGERIDAVLKDCTADFTAIVPTGLQVQRDEIAFLERSLYPLLMNPSDANAYEIVESTDLCWGAVLSRRNLARARAEAPLPDVRQSLVRAGITVRKPEIAQYPLQLDNFLTAAKQVEQSGEWDRAAKIYDFLAAEHGNTFWMRTLQANALYQARRYDKAAALAGELNRTHATVSRLLIEARSYQKQGNFAQAIECYRHAEAILDRQPWDDKRNYDAPTPKPQRDAAVPQTNSQEKLEWIH